MYLDPRAKSHVTSSRRKIYTECISSWLIRTIFPNMKHFIHSASKFYTPASNQFRVSCPKMYVFLHIFQKLIHLWRFKAISTEFIKRSIILSGACSKRCTHLRKDKEIKMFWEGRVYNIMLQPNLNLETRDTH